MIAFCFHGACNETSGLIGDIPATTWRRPVGVTVARDGSLLVADDGGGTIWQVRYGS